MRQGRNCRIAAPKPGGRPLRRACVLLCVLLCAAAMCPVSLSQEAAKASAPSVPARTWAVDCAKNEEAVIQHPGSYLRYRLHEVDQKGDRLRDQIETPQGTVARMIQHEGRALTAEEDAAERARLKALVDSPDDFARHIRHEEEGRRNGLAMLRLMPDAMLWSYAAGQPQLPEHPATDPALVVLDFKPDPKWSAPNLQSEVLTGLEGRVWIDPRTKSMVHVQADVFHAINVGWGLVAHVYPGGTLTLQQSNVAPQRWIVSHIVEQITVRALLVKTVKQQMIYDTADYRSMPAMSYQQAIQTLLDTPLPH
jgi:hypothetical protein